MNGDQPINLHLKEADSRTFGRTSPMTVDCKTCRGDWPPGSHRIGDCGLTEAFLYEDQFFPGWTVLVLKRHATELFELTAEERRRMIEEVSAVARVLAVEYAAIKINDELLGNQLPHLHWHLIPRSGVDPAPQKPGWRIPHPVVTISAPELAKQLERLRGDFGNSLPLPCDAPSRLVARHPLNPARVRSCGRPVVVSSPPMIQSPSQGRPTAPER